MSKKYSGKNALVAAIMANAFASSLSSAKVTDSGPKSSNKSSNAADNHNTKLTKRKSVKTLKSRKSNSKSGFTEFNIESIRNHLASPKHVKTNNKTQNKTKLNRKKTRSSHICGVPSFSEEKSSQINTKKRKSISIRTSRSLSPNAYKKNKRKLMKTKQRNTPSLTKTKTKSSTIGNNSKCSLQSIHSSDEADDFDDILSPKHNTYESEKRKSKLRSVLDEIFGEDDDSDDEDAQNGEEHIEITPMIIETDKNALKYVSKTFQLSIEEDIEAFSMNLEYFYCLEIAPFVDIHIDDKYKGKTTSNGYKHVHRFDHDINTYSVNTNGHGMGKIYEEYVLQFGEPKTPKYLMSFAKQKGRRMSLSEAIRLVNTNKIFGEDIDSDTLMRTPSIDNAICGILRSEEDEEEEEEGSEGMGLIMSSTLLSATPEPHSSCDETNGIKQITHKKRQNKSKNNNKHKRNGNFDLFANMMHDIDDTTPYDRNCNYNYKKHKNAFNSKIESMTRNKRKKNKKYRSHSQPSEVIQDFMNEMDRSFDNQKKKNILHEMHSFDDILTAKYPPKSPKSGPNTPRNAVSNRKKKNVHMRSLSTDQKKHKALKLNEWNKNRNKNKNNENKKKVHKLDFNLYNIEIRPNRRYRLIDGRIGIAKFKGETVFGKGKEHYVGIMIEYGEGVHDGTVDGKSYFRCKHGKGDMLRPFQIIEDLGRFTNPINQDIIDDGEELIRDAHKRLKIYLKKNNLKLSKLKISITT